MFIVFLCVFVFVLSPPSRDAVTTLIEVMCMQQGAEVVLRKPMKTEEVLRVVQQTYGQVPLPSAATTTALAAAPAGANAKAITNFDANVTLATAPPGLTSTSLPPAVPARPGAPQVLTRVAGAGAALCGTGSPSVGSRAASVASVASGASVVSSLSSEGWREPGRRGKVVRPVS